MTTAIDFGYKDLSYGSITLPSNENLGYGTTDNESNDLDYDEGASKLEQLGCGPSNGSQHLGYGKETTVPRRREQIKRRCSVTKYSLEASAQIQHENKSFEEEEDMKDLKRVLSNQTTETKEEFDCLSESYNDTDDDDSGHDGHVQGGERTEKKKRKGKKKFFGRMRRAISFKH